MGREYRVEGREGDKQWEGKCKEKGRETSDGKGSTGQKGERE